MHSSRTYTLVLPLFLLLGCGSTSSDVNSSVGNENNGSSVEASKVDVNFSVLDALNALRVKSGMIPLSQNALLTESAQNHANYLSYNHVSGHYESGSFQYFTGVTPVDRTKYVSYQSTRVLENVSTGQESEAASLDGLMGAIYHRFAFLSFDINEIGAASTNTAYVYNMGNSQLTALCQGKSFEESGHYYYDICLDKDFKIESGIYNEKLTQTRAQNSSYVMYPYANQEGITPSFYEESPDPLPDYNVSGFPISVEFNANDFNMSQFSLDSFTLKDETNQSVELISYNDGSSIMKQSNDVNKEFSEYEFAIFPYNRLEYNQTYYARLIYTYDNRVQEIAWNFRTKELKNLLIYNEKPLQITLNKKYYIYVKPQDSADVIKTFHTNCIYKQGGSVAIENSLYDGNTLELKIRGSFVQSCKLNLDNGRVITVEIQ